MGRSVPLSGQSESIVNKFPLKRGMSITENTDHPLLPRFHHNPHGRLLSYHDCDESDFSYRMFAISFAGTHVNTETVAEMSMCHSVSFTSKPSVI